MKSLITHIPYSAIIAKVSVQCFCSLLQHAHFMKFSKFLKLYNVDFLCIVNGHLGLSGFKNDTQKKPKEI